MTDLEVKFGTIALKHATSPCQLNAKASSTLRIDHAGSATTSSVMSISEFQSQQWWVRCERPFHFRFVLCFEHAMHMSHLMSRLIDELVGQIKLNSVCAARPLMGATLLTTQVWNSLGFDVLASNVSNDTCGAVLVLSLGHSRQHQWQKATKGKPNQTSWSPDDLNTPPSVASARLKSVSLILDFPDPLQTPAGASSKLALPSDTKFGDASIDLALLATQLLLDNRAAGLGQKVCNGYKRFDGNLTSSFPSVLSSSYQLAVSQRADLCKWLSRSLGSFSSVSSQLMTRSFPSNNGRSLPLACSRARQEDMNVNLWASLLTLPHSKASRSISISRIAVTGQAMLKQSLHPQHGAVNPANEITEVDASDDMIVDPSPKACDDAVADDDLFIWESKSTTLVGEGHCATSHVEEPVSTKHMQLSSSSSRLGEWDTYRMCNTVFESSQSSMSSSDSGPSIEDANLLNPDYDVCDDFIGPSHWLTQRPEAKGSQAECMLTGRLSVQCAVNDGDLYESLFSYQSHGETHSHNVAQLNRLPAQCSPVSATDQASVHDSDDWILQSEVTALKPDYTILPQHVFGQLHDISAVIEQPLFDLNSPDDFDSGAQSDEAFDILQTPKTQRHRPQADISSSMKRSSTSSSSSSSSESSVTSRHSRSGSLLKMLSGNSAKVTDETTLANINIELESIRDRSVVVKRRKTLDDYNTGNNRDDEMLFV
jgi:hypothetical protein